MKIYIGERINERWDVAEENLLSRSSSQKSHVKFALLAQLLKRSVAYAHGPNNREKGNIKLVLRIIF